MKNLITGLFNRPPKSRLATERELKDCYQKHPSLHSLSLKSIQRMEQLGGEQTQVYQIGWFTRLFRRLSIKKAN